MPQVQPFIGTLHVVRLFLQLPQLFGGQAHAVVGNGEGNGRVRAGKAQADGTGMLSSAIPLLLCAVFPNYSSVIMFAVSVLILAASFALYGKLRQYQLYET